MSCKILPILAFFFFTLNLWAQKPADRYRFEQADVYNKNQSSSNKKELTRFEKVNRDLVLIRNENSIIPIKGLVSKRIAYISIGLPKNSEFERTLKKYTKIDRVDLPVAGDGKAAVEWAQSLKERYNLFIIGIEDRANQQKAYLKQHFAINAIIKEFSNICVTFGGGQIFQYLPTLKESGALIITPDEFEYSESVAAQATFGALPITGQLTRNLGGGIEAGMGLSSQSDSLLKYTSPSMAGMNADLLKDSIKAIVEEGIEARAYPGAQVLVARKGQVIYHKTFGFHTYDSLRQVEQEDVYDFASVTKVSSALPALMKLYGEGHFDLDAPLVQYFPKFKKSNKADLSFRSMLAHNAKLMPWIPYWRNTVKEDGQFKPRTFNRDSSKQYSVRVLENLWLHKNYRKKMFKAIKKSPLNDEPGFVYSGLLFYLLPDIVADLSKQDFETHIKNNIYRPIGAYSITYNAYKHYPLEKIIPTERDTFFRMAQLHGTVHDEGAAMMGGVSSNAGLFGTANDLAKLFQMYMNYGQYGGEQIIPRKAVKEFTKCQFCAEDNHRGLGFDKPQPFNPDSRYTALSASPDSFGHSGYTGTFVWADPQEELILIFFSNRVYPTRDNRKLYEMNIRPRLHQAVYDAILKDKN